jgi:integrase/recombinase XerC
LDLPTTTDLVALFIDAKIAAGLSPRTIETYRQRLARFTAWLGIRPITRTTLRGYLKSLQEEELSPVTRAAYFRDVTVLCSWLAEEQILVPNHAKKLAPKVPKRLPASYSVAHIEQLLAVCTLRDRAMIILLLDTGLRAGELCSLRRHAVHPHTGRFEVIGKGDKLRACWCGPYARIVLATYLASRRDASPWLWPNRYGQPITRNGLYQLIRRAAIRAGIRGDVRRLVHSFRASFAKHYVQQGGDLESLRRLLGHESIQMAAYYAQLDDDELAARKAAVNPLAWVIPEAA